MLAAEEVEQFTKQTALELLDIVATGKIYRTWADRKEKYGKAKATLKLEELRRALSEIVRKDDSEIFGGIV